MAAIVGLFTCFAVPASRATAEEGAPLDAKTSQLLARYIGDPAGYRRSVQALERAGLDRLPVGTVLAVGDAYMRSGNNAAAIGVFAAILERNAERPWSSIAELGIGWAALAEGDLATARVFFADGLAAESGGQNGDVAQVVPGLTELARMAVGLLGAYEGGGLAAAALLEQVVVAPGTDPTLRPVARLSAAYARYWVGNYPEAAAAFELAALEYPDAPTADDARYGAAWSRWQNGERGRALDALHTQARSARPSEGRASDALVDLQANDVVIGGLRDDHRPTVGPTQRLAGALDLDGVKLARLAIRRIERGDDGEDATDPGVLSVRIAPGGANGSDARIPRRESSPSNGASVGEQAAPDAAGGEDASGAFPESRPQAAAGAPDVQARTIGAAAPVDESSSGYPGVLWLAVGLLAVGLIGEVLRRGNGRSARRSGDQDKQRGEETELTTKGA